MDWLPEEIQAQILLKLPIRSLILCRSVCKSWYALTRNPYFVSTHLNQSSDHPNCLVLSTSICINFRYFFTQTYFAEPTHRGNDDGDDDNNFCGEFHFSRPNFEEFNVVGCCNGLLCLAHEISGDTYVWNPCTGDSLRIPRLISRSEMHPTGFRILGFGFDSRAGKYKVIQSVYMFGGGLGVTFVYTLGDNSWRFKGNCHFLFFKKLVLEACVHESLHVMAAYGPKNVIVSFDVAGEEYGLVPCPEEDEEEGVCEQSVLGVVDECLALSHSLLDENKIEIWVMKEYGVKESWAKFFSIEFSNRLDHWNVHFMSVVCFCRNGEVVLMVYRNSLVVSYDMRSESLKTINFVRLPAWFKAISFVGSLVSPSTIAMDLA